MLPPPDAPKRSYNSKPSPAGPPLSDAAAGPAYKIRLKRLSFLRIEEAAVVPAQLGGP